ncbi:MAGUK p55 subfamily member 7-like [Styela clava]
MIEGTTNCKRNMVGKTNSAVEQGNQDMDGDGLQDILQTVQKLESRLQDDGDNIEPLNDILLDKNMQALIKVHETVKPVVQKNTEPTCTNSLELVSEVHALAMESEGRMELKEIQEISSLFKSSHHLTALMKSHDQIASKNFAPELPEPDANDYLLGDEEESMKVVRLVKGNEPLGATIAVDELTNNIIIARILKGGAADRSGLIHVNDILVEVNKVPAIGKKPEELIAILADFQGPLTFRLIPGETTLHSEEEIGTSMYVQAKINYDPARDHLIPCPEAGLKFFKNDILHIVSRDDESWWQASIVNQGIHSQNFSNSTERDNAYSKLHSSINGSTSSFAPKRAGLVPSARLQNRRETLKRQATIRNINNNSVKGSSSSLSSKGQRRNPWTLLRQSFRRSNRHLDRSTPSPELARKREEIPPIDPATVVAYEEVTLLQPPSESPLDQLCFRPFVLVGPQGVGRNVLKDRLIDSNPTHYGVPVPHTSRAKLEDEEDGKDYHFVTREYMEQGIRDNLFLEYGEYKGNLYGTSLEAVKAVISCHQVCVLTPYPQALKILRNGALKPFIVFVKPPKVEKLLDKSGQTGSKSKLTIDRDMNVPFSTEELQDLVKRGEKMESSFGHMFDYVVVNDGVDRAFAEIKQVAFAVENEPQWIPKMWVKNA